MIVKDETTRLGQGVIGAAVLLVGIAIGFLAKPETWRHEPPQATARIEPRNGDRQPEPTRPPMQRAETIPPEQGNGLPTLYVDLAPRAAARLQAVRDRAHARGQILQEPDDMVKGTVRVGERTVEARVRIKGDFLDHLRGDKWSLRIELKDGTLFGMSRMSIQSPPTRGYLWEWLVMAAARRDGLLAPRSMFVNVVVNNNPTGICYLEEHFSKELLESQGRRDGPIVRYVEDTYWTEFFQHRGHQGGTTGPKSIEPSQQIIVAELSAFGERRLAQSEALARQLGHALSQLRLIQDRMASHPDIPADALARAERAIRSEGRSIDSVLDTRSAADMHALMCLFRCNHALVWPNRRFYHNPITGRLEPIVFDTLAGTPIANRDPIGMSTWTVREFLKSPSYYNRLFERLGELAAPGYLESLFEELEPDLTRYAQLLRDEGFRVPQTDAEAIKNQLYDQQVFLRELLRPMDGVNFDCRLLSDDPLEDRPTGTIEVEAWATTRVPVVLRGFRFGNDRFVTARQSIAKQNPTVSRIDDDRDAVVLPNDGRHVVFRFPIDERLAGLRDIRAIKKAVRSGSERDLSVKLSLQAEYRYIGNQAERVEELSIRRFGTGWGDEWGRPESPTLEEVLRRHAFLSFDPDRNALSTRTGEWDVDGDLAVPDGVALRIGPGVTLRFDAGAAIIASDALVFEGTSGDPIVLEPKPGVPTWAGVVVIEAATRGLWRHVSVRDADAVTRGGWVLTGGITFYRSPVDLFDCTIRDARGEDALNIYDCDFLLERVTIDGTASDAFDGDFVTGTVRSCTFSRTVEDAVDVSGSDVQIIDTRFIDIGDKCVSAGENSTARVLGGVVESASIAIASKDSSHVAVTGLDVRQVENYVLAAYIKKPEYGPSTIVADKLTIGEAGRAVYLVQTPCELTLEGESIAGIEVDVADLYERKILGK